MKPFWGALLVGVSVSSLPMAAEYADRARQPQEMVRTIEQHARYTSDIVGEYGLSPRVLDVMQTVKRHLFITKRLRSLAYDHRPFKIG